MKKIKGGVKMSSDIKENTVKFTYITKHEEAEASLKTFSEAPEIAIDTETTGEDPHSHKLRLIQLATKENILVLDMFKLKKEPLLDDILSGPALKIFHNGKFDIKFILHKGYNIKPPYFDTMIANILLTLGINREKGFHSLSSLIWKNFGIDLPKELQRSDWSKDNLSKEQLEYSAKDVKYLILLKNKLLKELERNKLQEAAHLEFSIIPSIALIELYGMPFDITRLEPLKQKTAEQLKKLELSLKSLLNIKNLNSHKQISQIFHKLGIDIQDTKEETLSQHTDKHKAIPLLMKYRKLYKLYNSYLTEINLHPVTGRIHSTYWPLTATGRFSCNKPNIQQTPRMTEYRSCFVPEPGKKLIIGDYSQIELRIAAEISRDRTLINSYKEGHDIHKLTASLITRKSIEKINREERHLAKALNFGLLYGQTAGSFAIKVKNDYGINITEKEAAHFRYKFFNIYRGLKEWHETIWHQRQAETRSLSGRRRLWPSKNKFNFSKRINTPVQGTGADILKYALSKLPETLKDRARIIGIIHDEIILEAPEEKAQETAQILKEIMENAGTYYLKLIPVEADVKICNNWAEK